MQQKEVDKNETKLNKSIRDKRLFLICKMQLTLLGQL